MGKAGELLRVGVAGAVLFAAVEVITGKGSECMKDLLSQHVAHCLPDWHWSGAPDIAHDDPNAPITSRVYGGILDVKVEPLTWPLFSRPIELDPLQVIQNGKVIYQQSEVVDVTTSMKGQLAVVESKDNQGILHDFVMARDTNGTPDQSDDKLKPINVNTDFQMSSSKGVNILYYDSALESGYEACKTALLAGDTSSISKEKPVDGCVLTGGGKDPGHGIVQNIEAAYLGFDRCTVDTVHVLSNVVVGHEVPNGNAWQQVHAETTTVSAISAKSLHDRIAGLLASTGVLPENVEVVMETDANGQPVEWNPSQMINLDQVAVLSNGKYKVPDVFAQTYCAAGGDGAWKIDEQPQFYFDKLSELVGPNLMKAETWNQYKFVDPTKSDTYPREKIAAITFDSKGQMVRQPLPSVATTTTTTG